MGQVGPALLQALIKVVAAHPDLVESIAESLVQLIEAELKKAVAAKQS